MFKRRITALGIATAAISLGFVQAYTPIASSLFVHVDHRNSVTCYSLCSTTAEKRKEAALVISKKDKEPSPDAPFSSKISLASIGIGLLADNNIWRQSSWVPPDITLLGGRYSSGL